MLTAQLEARRHGIGGSDAAVALRLSPWKTPLELYLEKTGQKEPDDISDREAVIWGNLLEDTVAREYARRTGCKIRRRNQTVVHPELPFILGNIDREIVGQKKLIEVKTTGFWPSRELGKEGTDQVPDAWLVQVHHYMLATGYRQADIAALVGGQSFRIYPVTFDQELADLIVEKETWFWRECVEKRSPPPPTTVDDLALLYAQDNGGQVEATDSVLQAVTDLKTLKGTKKDLDTRIEELEFQVKAALGDNAILTAPDGRTLATWKSQTATRLDQSRLKAEDPGTYAKFQTESSFRVLRVK